MARQEGMHGGLAIGWQRPACRLHSPRSALRGAEQSRFSLGIWHTTRASPLPIRPPTHLHPSPIQTLLAINKQLKCQPVPGKGPRQLHPICRRRNSCLMQSPHRQAPSMDQDTGRASHQPPCGPPASGWLAGQSSVTLCPQAALSITPAPKASMSTQHTMLARFNTAIRGFSSCLAPSFLTFLLWAFVGKPLLDTDTQLDFAQIPKLDVA